MPTPHCPDCDLVNCHVGLRDFLRQVEARLNGAHDHELGRLSAGLARCLTTNLEGILLRSQDEVEYRHDLRDAPEGRYRLSRPHPHVGGVSEESEAELERALYNRCYQGIETLSPNVEGILTYRMPLGGPGKDKGSGQWGEVDLIGFDPQSHPVVLELKIATNPSKPLATLLQAVSYAFAVRQNWNRADKAGLYEEWNLKMKELGRPQGARPLERCLSICAAPIGYWLAFKQSYESCKFEVETLCHALDAVGLPVQFATIDEDGRLRPTRPWAG